MRRFILIILVICMCAALCIPASASNIFFTAVDDNLISLSSYMPKYINGILYAPYTAFTQSGLGISYSGGASSDVVSLYNSSYMLYFNTAEGFAFDTNLSEFDSAAVYSGGMLYVPVGFVCAFFGLRWSVISADPAPVLRICSSNAAYTDSAFIGIYQSLMQSLVDTYNSEVGTDDEEPVPTATIILSFYDISGEYTPEILDILDKFSCRACFFVTEQEIIENADLMRRICGSGHSIGIYLTEGTEDEFESACDVLFEAARATTVLVASSDDAAENTVSLATQYGLMYWSPEDVYDSSFSSYFSSVTGNFTEKENSSQSVLFACSEHNNSIMPSVFSYLIRREYNLGHINELTTPI